ncbi:MAG: hypothetical protein JNM39_07210 [Bdellovibrionaceae bacterium]|nr:hypothetical protein [Pseudobdellovibrionaceae bacterium]
MFNLRTIFFLFFALFGQTIFAAGNGFETFYQASPFEHVMSARVVSVSSCVSTSTSIPGGYSGFGNDYLSYASFTYTLQIELFIKENGRFMKDQHGQIIRQTKFVTILADRPSRVLESPRQNSEELFFSQAPYESTSRARALEQCDIYESLVRANMRAWK